MDQEPMLREYPLEGVISVRGLPKSPLRFLGQFCALLLLFSMVGALWSFFVGESRQAHISQCETSPEFLISVDAPNAPWGSLDGVVELPDGLREQLVDGSLTIGGRFRNGEFHGPDGLVVDQLSAVVGDCPLRN